MTDKILPITAPTEKGQEHPPSINSHNAIQAAIVVSIDPNEEADPFWMHEFPPEYRFVLFEDFLSQVGRGGCALLGCKEDVVDCLDFCFL